MKIHDIQATVVVTHIQRKTKTESETTYNEKEGTVSIENNESPAYVKVGAVRTYNLGNWESLKVDVSISVPCAPDDVAPVLKELTTKLPGRVTRAYEHFCETTGIVVEG